MMPHPEEVSPMQEQSRGFLEHNEQMQEEESKQKNRQVIINIKI